MSRKLDSERASCLLYLDDPVQAELADYLNTLTAPRRGEVLREILKSGWGRFKKDMGIDEDPDEIAARARKRQESLKKKTFGQKKKAPRKPNTISDSNEPPYNDDSIRETESLPKETEKVNTVDTQDSTSSVDERNNTDSDSMNEREVARIPPKRNVEAEDVTDEDENDEGNINPLSFIQNRYT